MYVCTYVCVYFYTASPTPLLLLRGAPDYSKDTVSELTRRSKRHRQFRVKDLPKVPTQRLQWDFRTRHLPVTRHRTYHCVTTPRIRYYSYGRPRHFLLKTSLLACLLACLLAYLLPAYFVTYLLACLLACLLTYLLTYLITYLLTYSITQSLNHSLPYLCTCCFIASLLIHSKRLLAYILHSFIYFT